MRLLVFAVLLSCNAVLGHRHGEPEDVAAPFLDPATWVVSDAPAAPGHAGGAFDGRYVYAASADAQSGIVQRWDVSAATWASFDLTSVDARCHGFLGVVVARDFAYVVPHSNGAPSPFVARYDRTKDFTTSAAWTIFDVSAIDARARGFAGGVFDQRFVYYIPSFNFDGRDGVVVRHDENAALSLGWEVFDLATIDPLARGFFAGAFDGRFIYLVPNAFGAPHGIVARFDTHGDFANATSWAFFDAGALDARGFAGAALHGRYLYFAPIDASEGSVLRFDTQGTFTDVNAWAARRPTAFASGFCGVEPAGRWVYFVPKGRAFEKLEVLRYDTEQGFMDDAAWQQFDVRAIDHDAQGFAGGTYDGEWVHFAPAVGSRFLRFRAGAGPTSATFF